MINSIFWCLTLIICVIYSFYNFKKIVIIKKYSSNDILTLFDYFLDKSYQSIYETDLITHVVNNVNLLNEELETIQRNYVKTCLLYMGKKNKNLFIEFFGDEQTMYINMIRYMRKKINEDGLSKIINEHNEEQNKENG